jgi:hypothetical protein
MDNDNIETFIWRGQTRYKCPRSWASGAKCEFNSHSLELLHKHIASPHGQLSGVKGEFGITGTSKSDVKVPQEVEPEFKDVKFADEN